MRRLVVGVDGTDASRRALEWATATVGADGHLHAVTAVSSSVQFGVEVITGERADFVHHLQHQLDHTWTADVADRVASLTTEVREQRPADALADAAVDIDADAIVIGAHVHKLLTPQTIGHTTRLLLRQLPAPLVVVPDGVEGGLDDGGPVVVGIGHGEATEAAAWWASELADARGREIELVRATGDAPIFQADGVMDLLVYALGPEWREEWSHGDVARFAAAIQENSNHDVEIAVETPPGLPAVQLVAASERASLLVIGQHWSAISLGHHTPQPLRYALGHARCPVAVVPEAAVHTH